MESPAIVKVLLLWFYLLVEGSLWILLACLFALLARALKATTKVWILRFAFAKFWVSAVLLVVFGIFLAPEVPLGESTATLVQAGQIFFIVTAALIVLGPAYVLVQYVRMNSILKRLAGSGSPISDDGLKEYSATAEEVGAWHVPRVVVSEQVDSPALVGLWRQAIVLPEKYAHKEASHARQQVLAHELAHVMRRDPLWSVLPLLTLASMPWNPVTYWAVRQYSLFTEQAADDIALDALDGKKSEYAGLLARSATGQTSLTAGLAFGRTHVSDLKQRLINISRFGSKHFKHGWVAVAPIALTIILQPVTPDLLSKTTAEYERRSLGFPRYEVIVLPYSDELGPATPWAINESGQVALNYNWRTPFIWSEDAGLTALDSVRFDSQVTGINESGIASGCNISLVGAFSKGYDEITGLNGHAWDINDDGTLAGRLDEDHPTAFRYHPEKGLELLDADLPYPDTMLGSINNRGDASGVNIDSYFNGTKSAGFFWKADGTVQLLSAPPDVRMMSVGDINNQGQLVGNVEVDGRRVPIIWPSPDTYTLAERPDLSEESWMYALNNNGYSVGSAWDAGETNRVAMIWNPEDRVMALHDLCNLPQGLSLHFARDIADNMMIVCEGKLNGKEVAVLLKPIPSR